MDETNNLQILRIRHFEELRVAAEEMLEAYSKEELRVVLKDCCTRVPYKKNAVI